MFAFTELRGRVHVAFTDRWGGVSGPPFDQLNLAEGGRDHPEAVTENLAILTAAFAGDPVAPVVRMRQVHGSRVVVVDDPDLEPPEADALVTTRPGLTLLVRVADCVPVVLADAAAGVVGVAHAGRSGLASGVVPNTVATLRAQGAAQVVAWVGPHVCGACYEVPAELRAEVAALVPESWAETSWGTPSLDVGAGVRAQLVAAGVEVVEVPGCTMEQADLYSHRRDGADAGRFGGLVRLVR